MPSGSRCRNQAATCLKVEGTNGKKGQEKEKKGGGVARAGQGKKKPTLIDTVIIVNSGTEKHSGKDFSDYRVSAGKTSRECLYRGPIV